MRQMSEFTVPGFGLPILLCQVIMYQGSGMAAYVQGGYGAFRHRILHEVPEKCWYFGFVVSLHHNPDKDHQINDCMFLI